MAPLTAKDKCFNKTLEAGKGSKCLANDARISIDKVEEKHLEQFY